MEFDGYIFVEHNYPSRVLQHFSSDRLCAGKQSDASGQADNIDTAFGNYFYFCRPIIAAGASTLQQVASEQGSGVKSVKSVTGSRVAIGGKL